MIVFISGLCMGLLVGPLLTLIYLARPVDDETEVETRPQIEDAAKALAKSLGLRWIELDEAERQRMRAGAEHVVASFASSS